MTRPSRIFAARSLGLGLVVAGAVAGLAAAQTTSRYDGQYIGTLTLDKVIHGNCEPPPPGAVYPMTISAGTVRFGYLPHFDVNLIGAIDMAGNFHATSPVKHGTVTMKGHIEGMNVTATLVSPSCRYTYKTQ